MHLDAVEHKDGVVFLHAVKEGPANQSYGLQVAALAGVPKGVVLRARQKLESLERQAYSDPTQRNDAQQLDLFSEPSRSPALDLLETIQPDDLTPRNALDLVFELKSLLNKSRKGTPTYFLSFRGSSGFSSRILLSSSEGT